MQDIRTVNAELKLIIAGNHDVDLDEAWVRKNAEDGEENEDVDDSKKCVDLMKSHEIEGVYYLDEGRHEFELEDGKRISLWESPYTPEFNGYAFAYGKEENRFLDIPEDIDILITHGPPSLTDEGAHSLDVNAKGDRCGCKMLGEVAKRVKPRLHCFGHVHEGRGAVVVQWSEIGDGNEIVEILPDDGTVLSVSKEEKRSRSMLVNAAV
jgi:hypothetical protein